METMLSSAFSRAVHRPGRGQTGEQHRHSADAERQLAVERQHDFLHLKSTLSIRAQGATINP
jgi:hypothetical protein